MEMNMTVNMKMNMEVSIKVNTEMAFFTFLVVSGQLYGYSYQLYIGQYFFNYEKAFH